MASIFSKIIAGDIPCYKVAEDEHFFAFLVKFLCYNRLILAILAWPSAVEYYSQINIYSSLI